jgi:hypothetical protein
MNQDPMEQAPLRQPATRWIASKWIALVVLALAGVVMAKVPEPRLYPGNGRFDFELDFKHGMPKRVVVGTDAYWYLTYTVTNNTQYEQTFRPDFQMLDADGKVIKSDHDIPPEVFIKIKAVEGNRLLQPLSEVAGVLHRGADQAKDGVAVWPEPMARMASFKIFVGGLSGEYVILKDDDDKPMTGPDGNPIMLRKTLELDYQIYGDEVYPGRDEVHEKGQKWIMR